MKLKVIENKRLRLKNVFLKECNNLKLEKLDEEVKRFTNFVEMSKIQTRGPLITRMRGTSISDEGEITVNYDIMVQTVREQKVAGYKFLNEVVAENCLYVHYEGNQEDFQYVGSKLSLHIWENNLIETGEEYNVYLENEYGLTAIDVFKSIEKF